MPNTPANDAPYVIGAIEDAATADYPGLAHGNETGGFDTDGINPIVVNADGSFTAAFAVSAPSYQWQINTTAASNGTVSFLTGGGVAREYSLFSLTPGPGATIAYTLAGRNAAGTVIQIPLTPGENGQITITEAILANFAPGAAQQFVVSGLEPSSPVFGSQTVDLAEFYDGAAPTATVPTFVNIVPIPGGALLYVLSNPSGLTESFTLQNINVWANPTTSYRIAIVTQEQLDLTGITSGVLQGNVATGAGFRTILSLPPVGGVVSVPPVLLQQVESQFGSVTLQVLGATAGQIPQAQATVQMPVTTIVEGLYTQNFDADGNPTGEAVRVDVASNALLQDEDDIHYVMSRGADGGLVIAWLGNDDADGEADAVYVRRLDDAGNPVGDTVALSGLTAEAFDTIVNDEGEAGIAALADGGFAVAYTVEADEFYNQISGNVFDTSFSTSGFPGQLERVELVQFSAAGAISGTLVGNADDGTAVFVPVTIVDGVFQMTDALRAQFAADSHLTLSVNGLVPNSVYAANVISRDIYDFDATSTLSTFNTLRAAAPNPGPIPDVFIGNNTGQVISYQINSVTPGVGETPAYIVAVFTTKPVDVTGLTLYSGPPIAGVLSSTPNLFVNGYYLNSVVVTQNAGTVAIPASILAQIDGDQMGSVLMISGLAAGSVANVDLTVRRASSILEEGVFVQNFGADGVADGPAQRIDDVDATLAQAAPPTDDDGTLGITAHADGGFHVSWVAEGGDGSDFNRLITREFDSEGELTGTSINISGADIPGVAEAGSAGADTTVAGNLQVVELGNGGFATLVQVEAANTFSGPVDLVATGGPVLVASAQGRLTSMVVNNAVAAPGATLRYFIEGQDDAGNPLSIEVFAENGRVSVPEAAAEQFSPTYFLNFRVTGVQAGSTFSAFTTADDVWNYSDTSPIITSNGNWTVTSLGGAPLGLAFAAQSQAIAFDIIQATPAAGLTPFYRISLQTTVPLNTTGTGLPAQTFNPNLDVWELSVAVTPDAAGHIDVPAAMLSLTEDSGGRVLLLGFNLAVGSSFVTTTTERLPSSIVQEGLFVQLFDSAGEPTGDLIRVDDSTSTILGDEDAIPASIQSDGEGGFRVVWKSDVDGDFDGDGIYIRQFDQNGVPVGDATILSSIPDRVYDEGAAVTLYTSGLFADPDPADVLTFSATGLPDGLTIDPATGVITGTADEAGLHTVTVTATDAGGLAASTSFEIFVVDDGAVEENTAPTAVAFANVIAATPENGVDLKVADIVVTDDGQGLIVLSLSGEDADKFTIIGNELHFNGDGDFEGAGAYDVTVSARDGELPDAPVSAAFHLAMLDVAENQVFNGSSDAEEFAINTASLDNWTINMRAGDDVVTTGAGNDAITAGIGNDTVHASAGNDAVIAGDGNDFAYGEAGNDTLLGDDGDDNLSGGEGDDTLNGGNGMDILTGGADNDTIFGANDDDTISGDSGDDALNGGLGADQIDGNDGVDTINGDAGNDIINGGDDGDTIDGGNNEDTIHGDDGADTIAGGSGNDQLFGDEGIDSLDGGTGNDILEGGTGEDTLLGRNGDDFLYGGEGLDTINGGSNNDTIAGGADDDILIGEAGDDSISGGTGADNIDGGTGNDTVEGGDQDDTILGGTGIDTLYGDGDNDTINGNTGNDLLFGGIGNDTINGEADNDQINGEDGDDILLGGAGNDTIIGAAGMDEINGGVGVDILTGGIDGDTFVFTSTAQTKKGSADHITDFETLLDVIDLSAIDANTKVANDQAFTWIGAAAFNKTAGQLRYAVIGTATHVTGDNTGVGTGDFEIVIDNTLTQPLTGADFNL